MEGARDPGIFKAIFLAGGPGSGKSYVASQLFGIPDNVNVSKTGLKMVNQDAELELLLTKSSVFNFSVWFCSFNFFDSAFRFIWLISKVPT